MGLRRCSCPHSFIAVSLPSWKACIVKYAPDRYEEATGLVKVVDEVEVEGVHREHLLQRVEDPAPRNGMQAVSETRPS